MDLPIFIFTHSITIHYIHASLEHVCQIKKKTAFMMSFLLKITVPLEIRGRVS